MSIASRFTPK